MKIIFEGLWPPCTLAVNACNFNHLLDHVRATRHSRLKRRNASTRVSTSSIDSAVSRGLRPIAHAFTRPCHVATQIAQSLTGFVELRQFCVTSSSLSFGPPKTAYRVRLSVFPTPEPGSPAAANPSGEPDRRTRLHRVRLSGKPIGQFFQNRDSRQANPIGRETTGFAYRFAIRQNRQNR